ncbi:MAG: EamA family transporter [Phycisphaerae bacterium]|jgi:transporter family protein
MWLILGILSSLFLGLYDLAKKHSLTGNAVLPVLLFSTLASMLTVAPLLLISMFKPEILEGSIFYIPPISINEHLMIAMKSMIVASSWIFGYFAMKHLPISIISPIRATGPFWMLIGAVLLLGERPNMPQLAGILTILVSFYYISIAGKLDGIHFRKDKWVMFTIAALLLGTCSGLLDKYLISKLHYKPITVQVWFTFYMVLLFLLIYVFLWMPTRHKTTPFKWRPTIALVGVFLILADFCYFTALGFEGSLLTILSALRRASVLFVFWVGAVIFKERNIAKKAYALIGVLAGVMMILFSSR